MILDSWWIHSMICRVYRVYTTNFELSTEVYCIRFEEWIIKHWLWKIDLSNLDDKLQSTKEIGGRVCCPLLETSADTISSSKVLLESGAKLGIARFGKDVRGVSWNFDRLFAKTVLERNQLYNLFARRNRGSCDILQDEIGPNSDAWARSLLHKYGFKTNIKFIPHYHWLYEVSLWSLCAGFFDYKLVEI